ncbi:hypothetical protein DIPPA_16838 [Diplonema papillatum]|nr:hypothetical protein DIPPA_16838 [Diplonema papillatum]
MVRCRDGPPTVATDTLPTGAGQEDAGSGSSRLVLAHVASGSSKQAASCGVCGLRKDRGSFCTVTGNPHGGCRLCGHDKATHPYCSVTGESHRAPRLPTADGVSTPPVPTDCEFPKPPSPPAAAAAAAADGCANLPRDVYKPCLFAVQALLAKEVRGVFREVLAYSRAQACRDHSPGIPPAWLAPPEPEQQLEHADGSNARSDDVSTGDDKADEDAASMLSGATMRTARHSGRTGDDRPCLFAVLALLAKQVRGVFREVLAYSRAQACRDHSPGIPPAWLASPEPEQQLEHADGSNVRSDDASTGDDKADEDAASMLSGATMRTARHSGRKRRGVKRSDSRRSTTLKK